MDQEKLEQIVALFLTINTHPSDEQFHALAEALGVDHESLEAISYEMLSDEVENNDSDDFLLDPEEVDAEELEMNPEIPVSPAESDLSVDQKVQDGDYDEATTPADALVTNDGELSLDDEDTGFQDELQDDGYVEDTDTLSVGDQDLLTDDGVPDLEI